MGRSCCVINCTNKSHDYKGVLLNNGLSFHRFPGVKTHQGSEVHLLTTRRRRAWVAAVRRVNITFEHIPSSMYVCSRHFHGGKFVQNLFDHPPIPTHLAFCFFQLTPHGHSVQKHEHGHLTSSTLMIRAVHLIGNKYYTYS